MIRGLSVQPYKLPNAETALRTSWSVYVYKCDSQPCLACSLLPSTRYYYISTLLAAHAVKDME